VYLARQKVFGQVFGWRAVIFMALGAFVAALAAAILVAANVMP
jgi:hypothetical protein